MVTLANAFVKRSFVDVRAHLFSRFIDQAIDVGHQVQNALGHGLVASTSPEAAACHGDILWPSVSFDPPWAPQAMVTGLEGRGLDRAEDGLQSCHSERSEESGFELSKIRRVKVYARSCKHTRTEASQNVNLEELISGDTRGGSFAESTGSGGFW